MSLTHTYWNYTKNDLEIVLTNTFYSIYIMIVYKLVKQSYFDYF